MSSFNSRFFDDPLRLQNELFRAFTPWAQAMLQTPRTANVFPPINLFDDGQSFVVRAELPGIDKSSLDVSVQGDELTLKGERKVEANAVSYHRREREGGSFARSVTLPEAVDADKISATYKNGVLEVTLPRVPKIQPRRIEVQ